MKNISIYDRNKKALFSYGLVISLDSISFGLIAPILAPLLAHPSVFFSPDHSQFFLYFLYGILMAISPLSYMISAPLLGVMSDRYGRKRILLFCAGVFLFSYCGYVFAFRLKSIGLFIIARLLGGIGAGSQGVAQAAVVDYARFKEKPVMLSGIAIGMTMGLIVGPLASTLWNQENSYFPFLTVIAINIVSIFFIIKYVDDGTIYDPSQSELPSYKRFFSNPNMIKLFLAFFLFELGWSLFYQSLPLFFSIHLHLEHKLIGFVSSFIGAMLAIFLFLGTRIGRRYTTLQNLIRYGFIMGIIALFVSSTNLSLVAFLLVSLPVVMAVAFVYPGLISELSEVTLPGQQGLLMGTSDSLLALAFTITGMLCSLLSYVSPVLPFVTSGLCWAAGGFYYYLITKKQKFTTLEASIS